MENLLRAKGLWSLVETGFKEPPKGTELSMAQQKQLEEKKMQDHQVKHYLFQAIDRSVFEQILDRRTSKIVWDSIKSKFGGSAKVKRSLLNALRRDFEVLAMKRDETIADYFARVMAVSNKMRSNGEVMPDSKIVEKILRTLTEKFTYVVVSIEESRDTTEMSVDELQSSLMVHEQKFQRVSLDEEDQALKVEERHGFRNRGRGSPRGGSPRGRSRGRGRTTFSKETVECYKCHQLGHFQYECPKWNKEANFAEFEEEEDVLLMAQIDQNELGLMTQQLPEAEKDTWFIDSGCSNHMCGDKGMFTSLDTTFTHNVKLGNNAKLEVIGKGEVKLRFNGINYVIGDAYYIPELKNNLLSVGQLLERNLHVLFKKDVCSVFHPTRGKIAESTMSKNRMFALFVEPCSNNEATKCLQTSSSDCAVLWHQRYGHLSYKGLRTLSYRKMVVGLPVIATSKVTCEACMKGKQHRAPFPKRSTWRATKRLQLIHSDICGPVTPASNSQKRYLLTFIDDYTRKTWIYFLLEKSETFYQFKLFKASVEKECGLPIKCLRTDRGGEYKSTKFKVFCKEQGIKRQLTMAYTPQQNGVAERKNRTIMNLVRAILVDKKIPKTFWPEAVQWVNHVLNRSPTLAVKDKTPEEAWSGVKPSVEHFRVFGCVGHVHILNAKRIKLDDKSVSCVLLGMSLESKGYRLYDPIAKKIISSRDVIFEEHRQWDWDASYATEQDMELEWEDLSADQPATPAEDGLSDSDEAAQGDTSAIEETIHRDTIAISVDPVPAAREGRVRRAPTWAADYTSGEGISDEDESHLLNMALITTTDPTSFEEAVKSSKWRQAMDEEIRAIERNHTWKLVKRPLGAKTIGVKWVFKTKFNEQGEVNKYKARLVVKGYAQQYGIDYTEVYAPVARLDTVRMILAVAAQRGWTVYQLDVKSAFLYGELQEEVFVEQPKGYEMKGEEQLMVYKLQKALYGLKQAPRAWFSRIEGYFVNEGFENNPSEHTLFIKKVKDNILIVSVYVDDLLYTSNNENMLREFKCSMMKEFDMTDLGRMRFFLGIEVSQLPSGIFICQQKYASEVLKRFGMEEYNQVSNPIVPGQKLTRDEGGERVNDTMFKQLVGSLMYLTATRPDLMYIVSLISRFMSCPTILHYEAA